MGCLFEMALSIQKNNTVFVRNRAGGDAAVSYFIVPKI
jgi:hypothetical protein